jgi:phosphodiesterase/alkaline phosphatase D-like protein
VFVIHAVTAFLLLCALAYFFLVPRLKAFDKISVSVANGGVTHNSFVVQFHAPPQTPCDGCDGLWVKVIWEPVVKTPEEEIELNATEDKSYDSGYFQTLFKDDYNVAITLANLRPDTEYQYTAMMQIGSYARGAVYKFRFRTLAAPMAVSRPFSFVFGSCLMSRSKPLDVVQLIDPSGPAFATEPVPSFAVFLGDSVYLDAPYQLEPRQAYHQLLENVAFRRVVFNFPSFFQMDDHEIRNDADDIGSVEFLRAAHFWDVYLGRRNSGATRSRHHSFWNGKTAVLLLDTRSQRSPKLARDDEHKSMLGAAQRLFVEQWAKETANASVRLVISPVPWSASVTRGDGWRLYMTEREQLLDWFQQAREKEKEKMCSLLNIWVGKKGSAKTVLLSGDLHFAMIAEIRAGMFEVSARLFERKMVDLFLTKQDPQSDFFYAAVEQVWRGGERRASCVEQPAATARWARGRGGRRHGG